jgi:hypothetical protein
MLQLPKLTPAGIDLLQVGQIRLLVFCGFVVS